MTAHFIDLPPDDFPFTIEFIDRETGEITWKQVVPGPGSLEIPGLGMRPGGLADVRITWPDGRVANTADSGS